MRQKRLYSTIFLLLIVFLLILPFMVTFNEALTRIVESFKLYTWLQDIIVPIQIRTVALVLSPLNIQMTPFQSGFIVKGTFLTMTWNCVGWQSMFLLIITLVVGLKNSKYTLESIIETILIGFLGTIIMNLFRLSLIIVIFSFVRPVYAYVYHDYLAAILTIAWLFFFWWFSYSFILEER